MPSCFYKEIMVVSLKEVNMTFRKIKFLLGLTKRIAFVKKRNGDYLVYDNEKTYLKPHIYIVNLMRIFL